LTLALQKTNIHKSSWYKKGRKTPIRWLNSAEDDLKRSGVNNWKNKSANRMESRSVVGAVRVGTRL
jgi:hypothetical protein